MQAIKRECLTKEYIYKQAEIMTPVDPVQLERCIYAFEMLGRLSNARIPFIFKGGTAVLLRLEKLHRLSVDVDILCQMPKGSFEKELASNVNGKPFHKWEEKKRKGGLPKRRHYYFYYKSQINSKDNHIIIDVVEEKDEIYSNVQDIFIKMPFFDIDHSISVKVPCVNCLLSDKMTAFAPNTVGVKYDPENSMQIIKQLFDVGSLFDVADDLQLITQNYKIVFDAENSYRKGKFKFDSALDDTFNTSLLIAKFDIDKTTDSKAEKILRTGIENIQSHLVGCKFKLNEAKVAAGKAALLSVLIKNKSPNRFQSFKYNPKDNASLKGLKMPERHKSLEKLLGTNPEAFHYWYQAVNNLLKS